MTSRRNPADSPESLELQLEQLLRPVRPSPRLVQAMQNRLRVTPSIRLQEKPPQVRRSLLILGGVLSASLLLLTGVRAIFYLVNRARA